MILSKQIVTWCDAHLSEDPDAHVPATELRVSLGDQARAVDLCEPCEKQLVQPLRDLLEAMGQPLPEDFPGSKRTPVAVAPEGKVACPECAKPYRNRGSLRQHLRSVHGASISDVDSSQPTLPDAPPELDDASKPYACPDCERRFATPQGCGAHRNRAHGYKRGDDERGAA